MYTSNIHTIVYIKYNYVIIHTHIHTNNNNIHTNNICTYTLHSCIYRYLAANPMLWRIFYAYGAFPITKKFTELWSWQSSYNNFKYAINNSQPDAVVSVHPLCQLMPISIG